MERLRQGLTHQATVHPAGVGQRVQQIMHIAVELPCRVARDERYRTDRFIMQAPKQINRRLSKKPSRTVHVEVRSILTSSQERIDQTSLNMRTVYRRGEGDTDGKTG